MPLYQILFKNFCLIFTHSTFELFQVINLPKKDLKS
jgi:hypothetical protein